MSNHRDGLKELRPAPFPVLESLEVRVLFSVTISAPLQAQALSPNSSRTIDLFPNFTDPTTDSTVNVVTDEGSFQIQLFNQQTPRTVANFVQYVDGGEYNGTIVHRSIPGFVVQAGGYTTGFTLIAQQARVLNEPGISNTLGTVAMAKLGGAASSATSEFFVNTGNNSANLDAQNAGFTVFGQVINDGIAVVDQINNLPTTTVQGFSGVPVKNNPPTIPTDLVNVQSMSLVPQFTFAATSSDPGVLTAQISGDQLVLASTALPGNASVTVTATDINGISVSQTFAVAVGTLDVAIGSGHAAQTVRFTSGAKGASSVTLKGGGSATLTFAGSNLASTTKGTVTTVTGSGITIASLATSGTTPSSALTITGAPTVGSITSDASLKQINAGAATLNGNIQVNGTIGTLLLKSAQNGRIDLGGANTSAPVGKITLGSATNEDLVSDAPLQSISVGSWTGNTPSAPLIDAPALGQLTCKGDFGAAIDIGYQDSSGTLLGDLGSAKVKGTLGGVHWRVLGNAPSISAGSIPAGWNGLVSGNVNSFSVAHDMDGSLTAEAIGAMKVGGNINNSTITLNQAFSSGAAALKSLTINGAANTLDLVANSNLGSITVGSLNNCSVFAGVSNFGLPTASGDFANSAAIGAVTVRGRSGATFVNSNVAASSLGSLKLGSIQTANAGISFGIGCHTFTALSASVSTGHKITLSGVNPNNVAAQLATLNIPLGDFKVIAV